MNTLSYLLETRQRIILKEEKKLKFVEKILENRKKRAENYKNILLSNASKKLNLSERYIENRIKSATKEVLNRKKSDVLSSIKKRDAKLLSKDFKTIISEILDIVVTDINKNSIRDIGKALLNILIGIILFFSFSVISLSLYSLLGGGNNVYIHSLIASLVLSIVSTIIKNQAIKDGSLSWMLGARNLITMINVMGSKYKSPLTTLLLLLNIPKTYVFAYVQKHYSENDKENKRNADIIITILNALYYFALSMSRPFLTPSM